MIDGQEILRDKVRAYMKKYGSTFSHFYKAIGISGTHFHLFIKGERTLNDRHEAILRKMLEVE